MKDKIKAKLNTFFKRFVDIPVANYLLIFGFLLINVINFVSFSYTKAYKLESLSQAVSEESKKTTSGAVNMSFVLQDKVDNDKYLEVVDYVHNRNFYKTDIIGYDMRLTINDAKGSTLLDFDILGNDYAGVICRDMTFGKVGDEGPYINHQLGVYFEFPRVGSTKSSYKEGTTNFIYLRESDVNKLISTEGSEFYGLTHETILGKGIDVTLSYGDEVVNDKWKIDNIILETIDGQREENDKHLFELYGNYFMSSRFGGLITRGLTTQVELSKSVSSNLRNIKNNLSELGDSSHLVTFDRLESSDGFLKLDKLLTNAFNTPVSYDTWIPIISSSIVLVYQIIAYIIFANVKTYRAHNIVMYSGIFSIVYLFNFFMAKTSLALTFSNYAVALNLILIVTSLVLLFVAKINRPDLDPSYVGEPKKKRKQPKNKKEVKYD